MQFVISSVEWGCKIAGYWGTLTGREERGVRGKKRGGQGKGKREWK